MEEDESGNEGINVIKELPSCWRLNSERLLLIGPTSRVTKRQDTDGGYAVTLSGGVKASDAR